MNLNKKSRSWHLVELIFIYLLLKKTYWKQCRIVCEEQKLLGK
ncbi:hypothetical protein M076_2726 [Bacteroides fragilis str. 2-F-2 |uniref:Uncharacterized protein n=1 Tax=Bacteroides fragilis str. 2-F-2 \|nr:hypothetical protein M077_2966 [Bacteroides fragilis str. 2-F-2 \